MPQNSNHLKLAEEILFYFKKLDFVEAVILGGSLTGKIIDHHSDIDLYVYSDQRVPPEFRKDVVQNLGASEANIGLTFWDDGDEWFHKKSGIEIDMIYWDKKWIEDQLENLLIKHKASIGYSTCFWHTILNSKILFDRSGWFSQLQSKSKIPFPQHLKEAIITKNYPLLRNIIPSYYNQINKAIDRNDIVSINHRIAAFFASYFDIIFALNEIPHPGEKKILPFVQNNCLKIPHSMSENIRDILNNSGDLLPNLDELINNLNALLKQEGFSPEEFSWKNL
ncbi:MAG: DUF4037 domain-containing protein [Calditrichaeota bacterium]|nr:DUF4037 domain-containing protein [Calditrichota bacterium]